MEEATSLAREAFEEWMQNPAGNSATGNLRNKLCVVIGEREDLKAQLAALDADYEKLERQYSEACKALMVCDGAMMGKVKPSSVAFKMVNAILRPENAEVCQPEGAKKL